MNASNLKHFITFLFKYIGKYNKKSFLNYLTVLFNSKTWLNVKKEFSNEQIK